MNIEDSCESSFGRKRLCILTKHPVSILESFKIIVKGKVFMVRAKELFTWNPSFESHKEKVYSSDDESVQGEELNENRFNLNKEEEGELYGNEDEDEEIAETIFTDNSSPPRNHSVRMDKQNSTDPFGLYDLLGKKTTEVENLDPSPSLSHPPGLLTSGVREIER